jgi:hypothetical protein
MICVLTAGGEQRWEHAPCASQGGWRSWHAPLVASYIRSIQIVKLSSFSQFISTLRPSSKQKTISSISRFRSETKFKWRSVGSKYSHLVQNNSIYDIALTLLHKIFRRNISQIFSLSFSGLSNFCDICLSLISYPVRSLPQNPKSMSSISRIRASTRFKSPPVEESNYSQMVWRYN